MPTPQGVAGALSDSSDWMISKSDKLLLSSGQETGTSITELNTPLGTTRVLVRKSGTEPIVKVYCETVTKDSSKEGKTKALNLHDEIATRIKKSIELVKK
jgi:phosphomannomutase